MNIWSRSDIHIQRTGQISASRARHISSNDRDLLAKKESAKYTAEMRRTDPEGLLNGIPNQDSPAATPQVSGNRFRSGSKSSPGITMTSRTVVAPAFLAV